MTKLDFLQEIARLNAEHPICVSAFAFLEGYVSEDSGTLHVITLLRCAYLDVGAAKLPKYRGTPTLEEVESVLDFLDRAKPRPALRYLTCIGGKQAVRAEELDTAECIEDAASCVMEVLLSNMNLGATLDAGE